MCFGSVAPIWDSFKWRFHWCKYFANVFINSGRQYLLPRHKNGHLMWTLFERFNRFKWGNNRHDFPMSATVVRTISSFFLSCWISREWSDVFMCRKGPAFEISREQMLLFNQHVVIAWKWCKFTGCVCVWGWLSVWSSWSHAFLSFCFFQL